MSQTKKQKVEDSEPSAHAPAAPKPSSLSEAILVAQRLVRSVGKDARNDFHKYQYTSAEEMISASRSALHEAGLVFFRSNWRLEPDGTTVISQFTLAHPSSGETICFSVPWVAVPEKGRPLDKALAGALTTSLSYFLRDLLLLPREEEGAMDTRRDDSRQGPQRAWGQQPQQDGRSSVDSVNARLASSGSSTPQRQPPQPQRPPVQSVVNPSDSAPTRIDAKLLGIKTREANGRAFLIADLVDDDGLAITAIVHDDLAKSAQAVVGRRICAVLQMRGERLPLWVSIEEAETRAAAPEAAATPAPAPEPSKPTDAPAASPEPKRPPQKQARKEPDELPF